MTKKSLKIALVALVMMPMMALTVNGQTAASTAERNAAGKELIISVDKRSYSVGDKITVKVSDISKDAVITVWYNVVGNEKEEGKLENRKEMRKISENEHVLVVEKDFAGKWIRIVAENKKERVSSKEIIVQIHPMEEPKPGTPGRTGAEATDIKVEEPKPATPGRTGAEATDIKLESDKKENERNANQPNVTPARPEPTPKPAPAPEPKTTDTPSTKR